MESGQRGATVGQALQAYFALVAPPGFCQRFPFAAVVVGGWRKCAILRERQVESYVRRRLNDDYVRQCAGTRRAIKTKGRCAWAVVPLAARAGRWAISEYCGKYEYRHLSHE